ncbi:MAG TPA: LysR family transcriptional regulator [Acidimicrobiales bacterium]|jgi:DNA-binding transcriptional LysR family regulator|nr:LysR family transcriptional regulator [Acidimicrobiales bacterium]
MAAPTVPQLQALVAVAQYGHVTRAAEALGLTQPAVSHQLRSLERVLGLPVLERVGRGVRLTDEAQALVAPAATALSALRAVEEVAAARRGLHQGSLAIAASNTIGVYRLPGWAAGFLERYPDLEVRTRLVNTQEAVALLRTAEVDCALVEGSCDTADLESLTLEWDELVVVAAATHPLARLHRVRQVDLASHRYLAREVGSGTEAQAAKLLGPAHTGGPMLALAHVGAVREGVLAGLGYAVLPTVAVAEDLRQGRLVALPLARSTMQREFRALRRVQGHGPALQALWEHLADLASPPAGPVPSR